HEEAYPVHGTQLTLEEMSAIAPQAHKWKRKVAAHCHGDAAARIAIEAGVDSTEPATFLTEATLNRLKAKAAYPVPTRMAENWVGKRPAAGAFPPRSAPKAGAAAAAPGA